MSKELIFHSNLTDEEIHERFKDYDYSAALRESLEEMKEDVLRTRAQHKKLQSDRVEPVASANNVGYSSFQDPRLEPPEPKELEQVDDFGEEIELTLDKVIITVDEDGGWEYEDQSYPWAANPDNRHGDWYSEDYNVYLDDTTGVVEKFDEIAEPFIPGYAGRYQISCDATLIYNVSGVEVDRDYFQDEDGDIVYDGEEVYTDDAEVEFDSRNSFISNFKYSEIE